MTNPEQKAELHQYRILDLGDIKMLVGQIKNDATSRFDNGTTVRTSPIVEIDEVEGWARTRNTLYTLYK